MKRILILLFFGSAIPIYAQLCDPNTNSLSFNGHSAYVDFSTDNDLNITDEITVEAWIKAYSWKTSSYQGSIICKHGWTLGEQGYTLRAGGSGELSFNFYGIKNNGTRDGWKEVKSPPGSLQLNTWYHVAGTYDGDKLKLYINGTQVATKNFKGKIDPPVNYKLKIGRVADMGASDGRYWYGMIDEVRIWNRALSETEINNYMNIQPDSQLVNGLAGYWQFNEGNGTVINDLGNGNNTGNRAIASWNTDVPFTNGILKPVITQMGGDLVSDALTGNQWNLNGVPISGATGVTHTPNISGIYSVTATLSPGCSATSDPLDVSFVSVNDIADSKFRIRQIPTDRIIRIFSELQSIRLKNIKVFDLNGNPVFEKEKINLNDDINLGSIKAGIYMLLVQIENNIYKRKVVFY